MKKFISNQKNCLWTLLSLILVCEILLKINNKFIQLIGIMIVPFILFLVFLLIKNDNKKEDI